MKLQVSLVALLAMGIVTARAAGAESATVLRDQQDKISYSIGMNIGGSIKQQTQQQGLQLKPEVVAAGLKDALSGAKPLLTEQEVRDTLMGLQREMVGKMAELGEKNKKEGDAFLAERKETG